MQLLVYARNYGGSGSDAGDVRTFVGLAVGDSPQVQAAPADAGEPISFVEVRVPAGTIDLQTAVPILVAKAIAREPRANRRAVVLSCTEGIVRLQLAPGFADARSVCAPLMPLLKRCRVYGDTVTTRLPPAERRPESPAP